MPYCTECGAKNDDDSRYCDSCGAALSQIKVSGQPIAKGDDPISLFERLTFGKKISASGAGLAIICFFLPWVKACGMSLSGFEIATKGPTEIGSSGGFFLFLIPICAALIIWLVYKSAKGVLDKNDGRIIIGISAVPILILLIFYFKVKSELGGAPFEVFTFWFLLSIISFVASAVGAIIEMQSDMDLSP